MDITRYDLYRFTGKTDTLTYIKMIIRDRTFRKLFYFRQYQTSGKLGKAIIKILNHYIANKMSIDLPFTVRIGKGFHILHPYAIAFNSGTVIGENCTVLKGATIGNSKTGKMGVPIIGNNVYIGLNSTIVGGVTIEDNVMIAANTFVNFDVPANSIVIGSPGVIHRKENAAIPYLNNSIIELDTKTYGGTI